MTATKDIEIEVEVRANTAKAILVFNGTTECWIPKSQITDFTGSGDEPDLTTTGIFISELLANEKGLI